MVRQRLRVVQRELFEQLDQLESEAAPLLQACGEADRLREAMLISIFLFWQFYASPFWQTKPATAWTDAEIETLMTQSPWGQPTNFGSVAFLASARPLREAEEQVFQRRSLNDEVKFDEEDYRAYITQNPTKHIVLAVRMPLSNDLSDAKEMKKMEKECFVRVGKQKLRAVGHFPPTPSDPYLRLLFPRVPLTGLKVLSFGLYLPGVHKPYQDVELYIKDFDYRGQLEY